VIEQFLNYGNLRLLNLPGGKGVYDEVLVEDCYHKDRIPQGSIVIDVGGYYGEFGIWCAVNKGCRVRMFEPSPVWIIARFNAELNNAKIGIHHVAIAKNEGTRDFRHVPTSPVNSSLDVVRESTTCFDSLHTVLSKVECFTLGTQISGMQSVFGNHLPVCVKLDCEGGEQEIFDDESWLDKTSIVMLEFHYKDGPRYMDALKRHGFKVETTDPNPEAWRAIIYATKLG